LSSSNLSGQDIDSCDFSGGDLSFTNWGNTTKSIFYDCSLDKAIISTSFFKDNLLNGAKLFHTYFSMVEFKNKEFKSENSKEKNDSITSNFIYCKFINVSFDYRDLYQSNFICCIFQNCTFRNLDIIETKFLFSNLSDCDFSKVDILKTVDFRGSVFNNVILNNFISDCIFRGCRLGQPETIFIIIDNYIESSFTSKAKINESFFSKTILNKCDFSEFSHTDANEIKEFLNELERDNISHRKQEKPDE
jgi:uncharacterized protein YjbI with pentapeptide repeats